MDPFDHSTHHSRKVKAVASPSQDPFDHNLQDTLDDHLTASVFNQAIFPAIIIFIIGGMMATVIWPVVPHELFAGWLLLFITAMSYRFGIIRAFKLKSHNNKGLEFWRKRFVLASAISGTIWGSLVMFNFLIESGILQTVIILAVLGVSAGGINSYASIRGAYPVFLSISLFPVGVWILSLGDERFTLLTLLVLFYIALMRSAVRYRDFLIEGVTLGLANERLVDELSESNENLIKEKTTQEVLHKLAGLGLRNESLDSLLLMAIEIICQVPWINTNNKGAIFLAEPGARMLRLSASLNLNPELLTRCHQVKFGECLCGRAALQNKLIFSDCVDQRHDISYEGMPNHASYHMPIGDNNAVLGVLVLYLKQGHQKIEEEVNFLKSVSNGLANIIERIRAIESSQIAYQVIENTSDAIVVTSPEGIIQSVNPAFTKITGFEEQDVTGNSPRVLRSGHHSNEFYKSLWKDLKRKGFWAGSLTNRCKNGSLITVQQNISSIRDSADEISNYIGVFHDITHIKRAEEDMRQLAYFDALTALPNRHMFEDRLHQAVTLHQKTDQQMAILFVDIRGFRTMNQSFGYSAGDDVLRGTVQRLKTVVRSDDTLSRVGGDEFAVLMNQVEKPEIIESVIHRISSAMAKPFKIDGVEVQGHVHIGIALYPSDASDARGLIDCADTALHQATSELNDQPGYRYFSGEQKEQSVSRLRLESDLRHAVEKDELVLFYQPQFNLNDGSLAGAEALLRWKRDGGKLVPPNDFIPLAEQSGLIVPITEWIVPQVVSDWYASPVESIIIPRVAINISGHHIGQPERLIKLITDTLDQSGISPQHLELEVTESSILEDIGRATETLKILRELDVTIALDDFGTGYSSLSYLVSLPIDLLKLDRMFITDICNDQRSIDVVRGLIMMCHSIGIKVVAEGIETLEQGKLLNELGCDIVQGFYYGRPVPADEFYWKQRGELA